jgi:hypothetical protein
VPSFEYINIKLSCNKMFFSFKYDPVSGYSVEIEKFFMLRKGYLKKCETNGIAKKLELFIISEDNQVLLVHQGSYNYNSHTTIYTIQL